jgi:transposase-like protein
MDTSKKDYRVSIMEEGDGKKTKRKTRRFSAEFKKSALVLDGGRTIEAVVDGLHDVSLLCRVAQVSRAGFYAWSRERHRRASWKTSSSCRWFTRRTLRAEETTPAR